MSQPILETVRWTTSDLELLPDNGNRYEIIDGELFMTKAPHWKHQETCGRVFSALDAWSQSAGVGRAAINPGIIFTDVDNDNLTSPLLPGLESPVARLFA